MKSTTPIKAQIDAIYNEARAKIRLLRAERIRIYGQAAKQASEQKAKAVRKRLGLS